MRKFLCFGESEEAKIERELVPFLLRLSRIPKGSPTKAILAKSDGKTEIGKRLKRAETAYEKHSGRKGLEECILSEFSEFSGNRRISVFARTVVIGIGNNFDAGDIVRKTARELEGLKSIEDKRKNALRMQKYTLLASAGFFVPFILGTTSSIISLLSRISVEGSLFGPGISAANPWLIKLSLFCYCMILPAISAKFASEISEASANERARAFWKYCAVLLPLALIVFALSHSILSP